MKLHQCSRRPEHARAVWFVRAMGLLDDAIREHLELKRRRGADPTEVERLAREALGPVRRGPHDGDELPLGDEQATGVAHGDEGVEHGSEPSGEEGPLFDRAYEEE